MAYLLALLMNRVYANVSVVLCYAYHRDLHSFPTRRSSDLTLLDVRVFDEATKRAVYAQQTNQAKAAGTSNCSDCSNGHSANKTKIWAQKEMDADHVTAWTKGGSTDASNCEMLCSRHNRAKGNR